jgi:AbrB family looped-hinge helix DNA binding protein
MLEIKMRVTSKGQVTIPEQIRRSAGMLPGTEVDFVHDRSGVHLRKAKGSALREPTARQRRLTEVLDRLRGSATIKMTTEEILALTRGE